MAVPIIQRYQNLNKPNQYLLVKAYRGNLHSNAVRYGFMFEVDGVRLGNKWERIRKDVLKCMLSDYVEVPVTRKDKW